MALVILCGMDKCGKTTVAQHFISKGYEYIHMTSPRKGITKAAYMAEMLNTIASTADKNVVLDRSHYGELTWSKIFNREPLLSEWDVFIIDQACRSIHNKDVTRYYMYDDNKEAHKERMLKFKEPSYDYDKAYDVHKEVMFDHEFTFLTFQEAEKMGWISKND